MQNNKHYWKSNLVSAKVFVHVSSLIYVWFCYYEANKNFMKWMVRNLEDKKYLTYLNFRLE